MVVRSSRVTSIASQRHRTLGRCRRRCVSPVLVSVRRARRPMCGAGLCARIRCSGGIFGHGFSPAPGCTTRCWASSSGAVVRSNPMRPGSRRGNCRAVPRMNGLSVARRSTLSPTPMGSPPVRRSRSRPRCANRGCVNTYRLKRPRMWVRGRSTRSNSGTLAGKASRGSSRRGGGCIRWRPRTAMVRCDRNSMPRAG